MWNPFKPKKYRVAVWVEDENGWGHWEFYRPHDGPPYEYDTQKDAGLASLVFGISTIIEVVKGTKLPDYDPR